MGCLKVNYSVLLSTGYPKTGYTVWCKAGFWVCASLLIFLIKMEMMTCSEGGVKSYIKLDLYLSKPITDRKITVPIIHVDDVGVHCGFLLLL